MSTNERLFALIAAVIGERWSLFPPERTEQTPMKRAKGKFLARRAGEVQS